MQGGLQSSFESNRINVHVMSIIKTAYQFQLIVSEVKEALCFHQQMHATKLYANGFHIDRICVLLHSEY
jgi:hypothetical protein